MVEPVPNCEQSSVLIVDDDEAIRDTLSLLFEDEGYKVYTTANGIDALRIAVSVPECLVVVADYVMPRMDGLEFLEALKKQDHPQAKHRLVFLSAKARQYPEQFVQELHDLKIPLLTKPFNVDQLLEIVNEEAKKLPAQQFDGIVDAS